MKKPHIALSIVGGTFLVLSLAAVVLLSLGFRVLNVRRPGSASASMAIVRLSDTYKTRVKRFDLVLYRRVRDSRELVCGAVIGLPCEDVSTSETGEIGINGQKVALPRTSVFSELLFEKHNMLLPTEAFVILGDFTDRTATTRYVGPIRKDSIVGRVVSNE